METNSAIERAYGRVLSERNRAAFERLMILLALIGFGVHLLLIFLHHWGWLPFSPGRLVASPISAIYTPFSFILIYEVFLLIYYIPSSFTKSMAKQYEIITLIVVRGIFHDIAELDNTETWFRSLHNLTLGIDIVAFLILFLLIYLFYGQIQKTPRLPPSPGIESFVRTKQAIATALVPLLLVILVVVFVNWGIEVWRFNAGLITELTDINKIFYNEFFTTLIIVDVIILTLSLRYTSRYSQLIRNTGFVISTVLIRYSFTAGDIFSVLLAIAGVTLGVLTLLTYNRIARIEVLDDHAETP